MTSFVWNFIEKGARHKCTLCKRTFKPSSSGSTTPYLIHLKEQHGITSDNYHSKKGYFVILICFFVSTMVKVFFKRSKTLLALTATFYLVF